MIIKNTGTKWHFIEDYKSDLTVKPVKGLVYILPEGFESDLAY
ncbi:hypothetical protein PH505_ad00500 [Pseudoalteromonas distincta]|nr:hypothetical protein PH505_ad00500 [Pseudoalteromonas distincta]